MSNGGSETRDKTDILAAPLIWRLVPLLCSASLLIALINPVGTETAQVVAICIAFGISIILSAIAFVMGDRVAGELAQQQAQIHIVRTAEHQVSELFAMTDMLQAAEDHGDAGAILMTTAQRLMPDFGGAIYVFNNSRDRLDLTKSWSDSDGFRPAEVLLPGQCWALKRGKPHVNDRHEGTLCCMHALGTASTLEVPMMARGAVSGLLIFAAEAPGSYQTFLIAAGSPAPSPIRCRWPYQTLPCERPCAHSPCAIH